MLVICEDCGKKYHIDGTRITAKKAQFTCRECDHVVVVERPDNLRALAEKKKMAAAEDKPHGGATVSGEKGQQKAGESATPAPALKKKGSVLRNQGVPLAVYILLTSVVGFLMVGGAFGYLHFRYIPEIINDQMELRVAAIADSFSGVVGKPLQLHDYPQVNKEARRVSMLPGVAYAAVINKEGVGIAGSFSELDRFDEQFSLRVREKGVPVEVFAQNKLSSGVNRASGRIIVGGQTIYDEVVSLSESGGEVHVGIYVSEVDDAIREALLSPLTFATLGVILLIGFVVFLLLTRVITKPMQELTEVANRISLGEMDLVVKGSGPREMRNLASAFERMRHSIKCAMERLSK